MSHFKREKFLKLFYLDLQLPDFFTFHDVWHFVSITIVSNHFRLFHFVPFSIPEKFEKQIIISFNTLKHGHNKDIMLYTTEMQLTSL